MKLILQIFKVYKLRSLEEITNDLSAEKKLKPLKIIKWKKYDLYKECIWMGKIPSLGQERKYF